MTAFANTYPDDLRTVFGSAEAWERLYRTRLYVERTQDTLYKAGMEYVRQRHQTTRQAMASFGQTQIPPTEAQLAALDTLAEQGAKRSLESKRIARQLDRLADERKSNGEDFAMGEAYVGERLSALTPPPAVVRAIGERSLFSSESWAANRIRIEVFRYVVGEQRPNVTLGPSPDEDWAQHARSIVTRSVHNQQLAEIMVSELPVMKAAQYGHAPVLDRVGPPPPTHTKHSTEWWAEAVAHCEIINPPERGLAIDRYL